MVFSRIHDIFTKSQWIIRNNYENLFITAIFLTKIYALLNKPCVIYLYTSFQITVMKTSEKTGGKNGSVLGSGNIY